MPQLVNSVVVQEDQPNVSANVNAGMLMNPIGTVPGIQPSRNPNLAKCRRLHRLSRETFRDGHHRRVRVPKVILKVRGAC